MTHLIEKYMQHMSEEHQVAAVELIAHWRTLESIHATIEAHRRLMRANMRQYTKHILAANAARDAGLVAEEERIRTEAERVKAHGLHLSDQLGEHQKRMHEHHTQRLEPVRAKLAPVMQAIHAAHGAQK